MTISVRELAEAWAVVNEWERDAGLTQPTSFCPPFDPDLSLIGRR